MKYYFVFIMFCCHGNFMQAELFTYDLLEKNLSLMYIGEGHMFTPPKECADLLDLFADSASNFTKCSIKHARPIRLCEKCIDHYVNFDAKYEELMKKDINGTTCKSIFISQDRLDAVLEYHDNIMAVWNKGHCNECFDKNTTELSEDIRKFNNMLIITNKCINDIINSSSYNNSEEVCQKCMLDYLQLDEYYKSLSEDAIGVDSICMDVVDSMNATRSFWSKRLNCCKLRKSPEIIFLASSVFISILPLLYYVAVRYCGPIQDLPNVLKQSRFKQRFLRRGNGRIN